MGAVGQRWRATQQAVVRHERAPLSAEERQALRRLRSEAYDHGARLRTGGRGGLSPSLVLAVFRRDEYSCKVHGDHGEGEHGGLELHHKGGVPESAWLARKGKRNDLNNLVVVCRKAHDEIHARARAAEEQHG
jgi:hypothetical protein